jgi:beta-lactamase superfamily II metal-dependent hydrolase
MYKNAVPRRAEGHVAKNKIMAVGQGDGETVLARRQRRGAAGQNKIVAMLEEDMLPFLSAQGIKLQVKVLLMSVQALDGVQML